MKLRKEILSTPLIGTEKQKKWALVIRDQKALEIEKLGISGVLKTIRPHITEEILTAMCCDTRDKMILMAYQIAREVLNQQHASTWISDKEKPILDQLESHGIKKIEEWQKNEYFK